MLFKIESYKKLLNFAILLRKFNNFSFSLSSDWDSVKPDTEDFYV